MSASRSRRWWIPPSAWLTAATCRSRTRSHFSQHARGGDGAHASVLRRANVKLAGAYAGLSDSFDGPTHHSITDLAILRSLPNMTVVVPADPLAVALCRKLPRGMGRFISGSAATRSPGLSIGLRARNRQGDDTDGWQRRYRNRVRGDGFASDGSGADTGRARDFGPGCGDAHHQAAGWRAGGTLRAGNRRRGDSGGAFRGRRTRRRGGGVPGGRGRFRWNASASRTRSPRAAPMRNCSRSMG